MSLILWYCSILFLYISSACFLVGIVIGIPHAPITVLPWTAGGMSVFVVLIRPSGPPGLISWLWFRSHCHCKMWHQLRDSQLRSTITFDHE